MAIRWDGGLVKRAEAILKDSPHSVEGFHNALERMSFEFGSEVTRHMLYNAFKRAGWPSPTSLLGTSETAPDTDRHGTGQVVQGARAAEPDPTDSREGERVQRLTAEVKPLMDEIAKGPVHIEDLCNRLKLFPQRVKELIETARFELGYPINHVHGHIGIDSDPPPFVQDTLIATTVGELNKIAVISDTHLGSKYCMRDQLRDFLEYAYYEQGVRVVLHPGDVLDGCYRHGLFELTHHGLEDQVQDLAEVLPQLDGLTYHGITGNHDETFWEKSGTNVARMIRAHFQDLGRNDFFFYGDRDAFIDVYGTVVHLWHPRGNVAYAKSYHLQKKIEAYTSIKPQILLAGHWHQFCYIYERGIHAMACPTFQGSQSRFSRSLKGGQAQGGLILSWERTELGAIRHFEVKPHFYFEIERPVMLYNHLDAAAVPPAVARSGAVKEFPRTWAVCEPQKEP